MRRRIIYKITNPNGRIYIGQTVNLINRKSSYKNLYCDDQPKLYNSLKKYGFEKHKLEILFDFITTQEIINEMEILYIKYYNSNNLFNLNVCSGGLGHTGHEHTIESKQRMREAKLKIADKIKFEHLFSDENRKKGIDSRNKNIASGKTKHPRKGAVLSEETKQKIRDSVRNYYLEKKTKMLENQKQNPVE